MVAVVAPFVGALVLAVFGDLRVRKEGIDLQQRIAGLARRVSLTGSDPSRAHSRALKAGIAVACALCLAEPLVAFGAAPPAKPATDVALEALDSCLEKLNPEIDIGYDRIVGRCPQLARRLEESGWSTWFPRDWKRAGNDLSAGGLRELREILLRESARGAERSRRPSVAALPAALADLEPTTSARNGWWARTKEWLRDAFERSQEEDDAGWLGRLVGQNGLGQVVLELTSYVALMVVVLLAGIIVINELRVSGVVGRVLRGFARQRAPIVDVKPRRDGLSWDDVCGAPLSRRPQLLLEMVVARLTEASCLPPARALTVREVTRLARLSRR